MFGIFKRRESQPTPQDDITNTLGKTFDHLRVLADNPDAMERLYGMNARIASMMGALRDTYPGLPMADDGPGMTLIESVAARDLTAGDELANGIFELIRGCPDDADAKMSVMIYIMSPASIPAEDRPHGGVFERWA